MALATGEPSTYFNIYVPPNNDATNRYVALIVTAIQDSTHFEIIDDGMDGDTDDSHSGILMANQSYILYIKDNGIKLTILKPIEQCRQVINLLMRQIARGQKAARG